MPAPETSLDLIQALRRYASHDPDCSGESNPKACSCGLSEFLERALRVEDVCKAEIKAEERIEAGKEVAATLSNIFGREVKPHPGLAVLSDQTIEALEACEIEFEE